MVTRFYSLIKTLALMVCFINLTPFMAWAQDAQAPTGPGIRVQIDRGSFSPFPIAIADLDGSSKGAQISQIVRDDLKNSGLFSIVPSSAFIQHPGGVQWTPRFEDWRLIKADGLVHGDVTTSGDKIIASFRLWDTQNNKQMIGKTYSADTKDWRRVGHMIADAVYKAITGDDGYFDTQVVYIAESGPVTRRIKRLAIMDQDGANSHNLTNGQDLVLTPRFSPNQQDIAYLRYVNSVPKAYVMNLTTGRQQVIGSFQGMTFAPRFSPDGSKIIMSHAQGANTDIYVMDLRSRTTQRLTNDSAINISPDYSPDGSQIAFTSDRGGRPQIYVMNANGSNVHRISFGQGSYSTPVWSPKGNLIAFTRQDKGVFHIGVMAPDGKGERILTTSYLDEGPTWAPNGRVIMFSRKERGGNPHLYTIDISSGYLHRVPTTGGASDPAWSPKSK